jgi:integrase
MVKHCMASPRLVWLGQVINALAHLGVRIGELAGLRCSDVDLKSNVVRIADERASRRKTRRGIARTTKGERSRAIPIHPRLRKLFLKLPRKPDGRVFHVQRGGVLRRNNVRDMFIRDVIEPLKDKFRSPSKRLR